MSRSWLIKWKEAVTFTWLWSPIPTYILWKFSFAFSLLVLYNEFKQYISILLHTKVEITRFITGQNCKHVLPNNFTGLLHFNNIMGSYFICIANSWLQHQLDVLHHDGGDVEQTGLCSSRTGVCPCGIILRLLREAKMVFDRTGLPGSQM